MPAVNDDQLETKSTKIMQVYLHCVVFLGSKTIHFRLSLLQRGEERFREEGETGKKKNREEGERKARD